MKKRILSIALALSLVAILVVPTAAYAETATSSVTGTASGTYSITVGDVSVGTISKSGNADSSPFHVDVTTADVGTGRYVQISVKGADGQLSGPISITPALQISSMQLGRPSFTALSSTDVIFVTKLDANMGSASATDVVIRQPTVTNTNLPPGSYSETLTFTATFGSSP